MQFVDKEYIDIYIINYVYLIKLFTKVSPPEKSGKLPLDILIVWLVCCKVVSLLAFDKPENWVKMLEKV